MNLKKQRWVDDDDFSQPNLSAKSPVVRRSLLATSDEDPPRGMFEFSEVLYRKGFVGSPELAFQFDEDVGRAIWVWILVIYIVGNKCVSIK